MNDHSEDFDQALLDKLVDGELTPAERRDVLSSLDDQPHNWRRLAMAFLEAQVWQRELSDVVAMTSTVRTAESNGRADGRPEPTTRVPSRPVMRPPVTRPGRRWPAFTGLAASFCVVFGLGFACANLRSGTGAPTMAPLLVPNGSTAGVTDLAGSNAESDSESIRLLLEGDSPDSYQAVDLPIVEASDAESLLLAEQAPFVPEQVRRRLERMGHEVQEVRRLIPLQLPDGREGVVPVNDVQVRFVGQKDFQ
jgi:hypothetical protein